MSAELVTKLMDTVESVALAHPDDEFVAAGLALFALALSKLPASRVVS